MRIASEHRHSTNPLYVCFTVLEANHKAFEIDRFVTPAAAVWGDLDGRNGLDSAISQTVRNSAFRVFPHSLLLDKVGLSGVLTGVVKCKAGVWKYPRIVRQSRLFATALTDPAFASPAMIFPESSKSTEVDDLLLNAQLRDALEPLFDESIGRVNAELMSTSCENDFLQSMLEWERAPILPICEWFEPKLELPSPDLLSEQQLREVLYDAIHRLFEKHIVLDFTDHLSDRQLYCLIYRDILPAHEKLIHRRNNYLHWDCANTDGDPDIWLRYYASEEDRQSWAHETEGYLPQAENPPYQRELPRAPL